MSTEIRSQSQFRVLGLLMAPAIWLERARGRQRLALILLYLVVAVVVGVVVWWANSLRGLPDVGDPFEVAAFRSAQASDGDVTAATLARLAALGIDPAPDPISGELYGDPAWPKASQKLRDWLASSGEALEVWREVMENPGAHPAVAGVGREAGPIYFSFYPLAHLALLTASRLEGAGDPEAAWPWYLAVLRAGRYGLRRGGAAVAYGDPVYRTAWGRAMTWADDPKVGAAALRRALDDVLACDAMTPPNSHLFKSIYSDLMETLDQPDFARSWYRQRDLTSWYGHVPGYDRARPFLDREPERSRRLVRLVAANWLAFCDRPPAARPPLVTPSPRLSIFAAPPDAPFAARALSPESLARWCASSPLLESAPDLKDILAALDRDRLMRGTAVVHLAEALYERDHGKPPPSDEALVGPYLPRLPAEFADLDGTAPVDGKSGTP